jgi:hypothetical protein
MMIFKHFKWVLYVVHFLLVVMVALIIVYGFLFGADEVIKILNLKHK